MGVRELIISERKTAPLKRFTESTLLDAKTHHLTSKLRGKKDIKTPHRDGRHQAKIIETLQQRQFIVKDKGAHLDAERAHHRGDRRHAETRYDGAWEAPCIPGGPEGPDSFISEIADTVRK
ncbi:MAG: hypothetical protein ACLUEQ_12870 [Cloacibacillus evryensis]